MSVASHLPLVELTRGELVESIHYGSVAIVDSTGKSSIYGESITPFFLRSSAKPFQALAFLENNGTAFFNMTRKEIAILCSSHSGTDGHVAVLKSLQKKIGIQESDLQCGVHPPYDSKTQEDLLLRGEKPTPLRHNCSGKHTGMLAFAKMLGAPLESYLSIDHPVQQAILKTISEICDIEAREIQLGIDGCSAPVFAIPLGNAALGFARLVDPGKLSKSRAQACRLIYQAMTENPQMVAGPGRFDTVFMEAMGGQAMSKSGAEGYLAIAIPRDNTKPGKPGLGITIKISDGDLEQRAAPVAALEILHSLGIIHAEQIVKLVKFGQRELTNWRGLKVGAIQPNQEFSHFIG
jgi:L-asparaginase II